MIELLIGGMHLQSASCLISDLIKVSLSRHRYYRLWPDSDSHSGCQAIFTVWVSTDLRCPLGKYKPVKQLQHQQPAYSVIGNRALAKAPEPTQ